MPHLVTGGYVKKQDGGIELPFGLNAPKNGAHCPPTRRHSKSESSIDDEDFKEDLSNVFEHEQTRCAPPVDLNVLTYHHLHARSLSVAGFNGLPYHHLHARSLAAAGFS